MMRYWWEIKFAALGTLAAGMMGTIGGFGNIPRWLVIGGVSVILLTTAVGTWALVDQRRR